MANYKCKTCGLKGYSKNITCRNLFTEDQMSSVLSNIINVKTEVGSRGYREVTLTFPYVSKEGDDRPNGDIEAEAVKMLRGLTDDEIEHWLCDHEWELVSGEPIPC